jgi:hypothetical protein
MGKDWVLLMARNPNPNGKLTMEMGFPARAPEFGGKGKEDGMLLVVSAVKVVTGLVDECANGSGRASSVMVGAGKEESAERAGRTERAGRARAVLVKAMREVRVLVACIVKKSLW